MSIFFSCVVNNKAIFRYQAYYWALSLIKNAKIPPKNIFVHILPEITEEFINKMLNLGVNIVRIQPFGDNKYCNKVRQLETKAFESAAAVVLMDADTITLDRLDELTHNLTTVRGKTVDCSNPSLDSLKKIFSAAKLDFPDIVTVDCQDNDTFLGNFNGGLYIIPGHLVSSLHKTWKNWIVWLLTHIHYLQETGHEAHVDQVSFCMALQSLNIQPEIAPSNYNFPTHLDLQTFPLSFSQDLPIKILHYHRHLDALGYLSLKETDTVQKNMAIYKANQLLHAHFDNLLFWDLRYELSLNAGSSMEMYPEHAQFKRDILIHLGIEKSGRILDISSGDLQLNKAKIVIQPQEVVICFDALIQQSTRSDYDELINYIVTHTSTRLIVAGYNAKPDFIDHHRMSYFYEPLLDSLKKTNKFSHIFKIASNNQMDILVAEVISKNDWIEHFFKHDITKESLDKANKTSLIFHAGPPKTGTSALQKYCCDNRDFLKNHHIFYPETMENFDRHQELVSLFIAGELWAIKNYWKNLIKNIPDNCKKIILSTEGLSTHFIDFFKEFPRIVTVLDKIFPIHIILFFRPQADFLDSYYRQCLKNPIVATVKEYAIENTSPLELLNQSPRIKWMMNYKEIITSWLNTINKNERITVFPFTKQGQIDFFHWLLEEKLDITLDEMVNESSPAVVIELLNKLNRKFSSSEMREQIISKLLNLGLKNQSTFLTQKQAARLAKDYAKDNEWVEKTFQLQENFLIKSKKIFSKKPASFANKDLISLLIILSKKLENEEHANLKLELKKLQLELEIKYNNPFTKNLQKISNFLGSLFQKSLDSSPS